MKLQDRLEGLIFSHYRTVNAVKTTLGVAIGLYCMIILAMPHSAWMVVTTIVVMSAMPQVGSAVNRAKLRIAGTLVAAAIAYASLFFFGPNPVYIGLTIVIGTLLFSYMATDRELGYAGTLAALSLAIMLGYGSASIEDVSWRLVNIIAGSVIALVVSAVVLPIRAKRKLTLNTATSLAALAELYNHYRASDQVSDYMRDMLYKVYQQIPVQRRLLAESIHESQHIRMHESSYERLISLQRSLAAILELLFETSWRNGSLNTEEEESLLQRFHGHFNGALMELSDAIRKETRIDTNKTLGQLHKLAHELKHFAGLRDIHASSYLWLHLQMSRELEEVAHYINSVSRTPS
ncbi:FUSC family protein [Endozoicomonas sp. Mp262]|uniref:FUSC family protein n=1 Tax=Endozoicomonas sp. Mp262 TaxID=2919499 RepID=UPI0021D90BDC